MTKSVSCFALLSASPTLFNLVSTVYSGARSDIGFGTWLANHRVELRNGRAEMIRATGAVLIASVLLYFLSTRSLNQKSRDPRSALISVQAELEE